MIHISPSVLGADLMRLGEEIELVERLGLTWLHIDNMDGHFVPNISFGPDAVTAIRRKTKLFLDVHLMLSNPRQYIAEYARAGADLITVHAEIEDDVEDLLREIAALGVKTGLSIKPGTRPEEIRRLLPLCDLVLVMTVEPGFGGQSLREDCLQKLPVLRRMIDACGRDIFLEVDGGIKMDNAHRVVEAGANVLVTGTGLFRAEAPEAFVAALRGLQEGERCAR
ncbi:MAG: ribulose-phosphate 3-epimerase [Clostridia bacterium]|nr:ribulose-phosphate 3-epimerase [Clostridia bacterium]